MNFDTLLQYQQLDAKLIALDKQFNSHQIVVDYNNANRLLSEAKEQFTKLSKKYIEYNREFEILTKELEQIQFEISDSENLENTYTSSEEMSYPLAQLSAMEKKLADLESKVIKMKSIIKGIDEEIQAVTNQAQKQVATIKELLPKYRGGDANRKEIQKQIIEKKQALEGSIDSELLEKYKTQAAQGKTKVVFEASPGNPMCPACFKHMGNAIDGLKNSGDCISCPECGAILIIK